MKTEREQIRKAIDAASRNLCTENRVTLFKNVIDDLEDLLDQIREQETEGDMHE